MKFKIVAFALLASVIVTVGAVISVMKQFNVVNASTSTPAQFTNAPIIATGVTLIGMKGPQTTNTTTVWVSYGVSTDGQQSVPVAPGQIVNLTLDNLDNGRANYVLSNLWFDVSTANDGLTVIYDQVK
jgi:hypothetical protein